VPSYIPPGYYLKEKSSVLTVCLYRLCDPCIYSMLCFSEASLVHMVMFVVYFGARGNLGLEVSTVTSVEFIVVSANAQKFGLVQSQPRHACATLKP
jgi:hypothetical protein